MSAPGSGRALVPQRAACGGVPWARPPLRALLFDLDGTLADTAAANTAAYRQALAEAGIAVDPAALQRVSFGRHWRQFLPELIGAGGVPADAAAIAGRKQQLYAAALGTVRLNLALLDLAAQARPQLRTALVTTASRPNVTALLRARSLGALFDCVVTGDDVDQHKPAPHAYLLAAERLGVPPARCLAFEDSDIGVQSAAAAGMAVVRVAM